MEERDEERDIMGMSGVGRGVGYIGEMSEMTKESREMMVNMAKETEYRISDTFFSKRPEEKYTYRERKQRKKIQ